MVINYIIKIIINISNIDLLGLILHTYANIIVSYYIISSKDNKITPLKIR